MKRMHGRVGTIDRARAPEVQKLGDDEIRAKTEEFRARVADGAELDDVLEEAFAVAREAGVRRWACACSTSS